MFLSKFSSLQNIIRSFVYGCCRLEFYSRREQEEEITERDKRDVGKAKIAGGIERERERNGQGSPRKVKVPLFLLGRSE